MAAIDHGFKMIARSSGQALARLAGLNCRHWKPVESTLQSTTKRLADRVFLSKHDSKPFLVYMEFLTYWDSSAPWSVLSKSALLAEHYRLPVVNLVYILRPRGYTQQNGTMGLEVDGAPTQQVWFHEVCLWRLKPEKWWEDEPGLMAILPLCLNEEPAEQVIAHAVHRIEATEADLARRADYLAILGIVGKLALRSIDVIQLIGRWKMEESPFFEEVRQIGRIETRQEDTLRVISARFGKRNATSLKKLINNVEDFKALDRLFDLALKCENLEDLRTELTR